MELIYNSNAIEGNKLTLKETYLVLTDGLTLKGKSLKDHFEAKNHNEAIHFLYDLVERTKRLTVSEQLIRSLLQIIVKDLEDDDAGRYRKGNVLISGSKRHPPEAFEVPQLMESFISWLKKTFKKFTLLFLLHKLIISLRTFTPLRTEMAEQLVYL